MLCSSRALGKASAKPEGFGRKLLSPLLMLSTPRNFTPCGQMPIATAAINHCWKANSASQRTSCIASAFSQSEATEAWPWNQADFFRVAFVPPPYGPMKLYEDSRGGTFNGVLVFKRDTDILSNDDLSVLEVFVAGDTAFNTWSLLTHRLGDRPMVHELMWTLLERMHGQESRSWSLLRVAIVELRDNIFIGRLFFGDAATGEVKWDCDCRPSDGCYLSLRAHCPFFIHRRVWDQACLPIRNSSVYKLVAGTAQRSSSLSPSASGSVLEPQNTPYYRSGSPSGPGSGKEGGAGGGSGSGSGGSGGAEEWQGKPANAMATADSLTMEEVSLLRPDDPDAIKLLKRQLTVAVAEENYAEAIRIRDHSWMTMYRDMHTLRLHGRYDDAHKVEMELKRQIDALADVEA